MHPNHFIYPYGYYRNVQPYAHLCQPQPYYQPVYQPIAYQQHPASVPVQSAANYPQGQYTPAHQQAPWNQPGVHGFGFQTNGYVGNFGVGVHANTHVGGGQGLGVHAGTHVGGKYGAGVNADGNIGGGHGIAAQAGGQIGGEKGVGVQAGAHLDKKGVGVEAGGKVAGHDLGFKTGFNWD